MLRKILIANRGEIAVRIIRTCQEMGIKTVAVFSEADRHSLHVKMADESVCIGESQPAKSYLNIPNIISAAEIKKVDAIHPGYGFLAENPYFAEICETCGIKFIGPPAGVIEEMGAKARAREVMKKAGIPIIPGSSGLIKDIDHAAKLAAEIGYPVIIKASAGGGGRGMRIVQNKDELEKEVNMARAEAEAAFGDGGVYLEKYLEEPHHIEFQILSDNYGNIVHLGERDCSIQRRHQKVIEESPSPALTEDLREEMGRMAVQAGKIAGYVGAGTIEFLLDMDKNYYFIEVNTRIQVEHPVTEWVAGLDLVKEQLRIAAGEELGFRQQDIKLKGAAIECRLNAEDPFHDFRPCPGAIEAYLPPGGFGVRVDSGIYQGYMVPPYYDSLLAKVIVWGHNRSEAVSRMQRAIAELRIDGVTTNRIFLQKILDNAFFQRGEIYTNFIQRRIIL